MRLAIIAVAAFALAGCESLTESQQTLRDQGRPYLIGEADGLKAYKWEIPTGDNNREVLVFMTGTATRHCTTTDASSCKIVDATQVGRAPITEESFAAMAKLTPAERKSLGLTR